LAEIVFKAIINIVFYIVVLPLVAIAGCWVGERLVDWWYGY